MELNKVIARLNELYHKSKESGLSQIESEERNNLRRIYLDAIKGQMKAALDRIEIVDESGNKVQPQNHPVDCKCGCGHHH